MKLQIFSKNIVHENINDYQIIECPICNREIKPYWEAVIPSIFVKEVNL